MREKTSSLTGKENVMKVPAARFLVLASMLLALGGCVAVVAGTVGALILDEGIIENDGKFDPFENTELGRAIYD